MCNREDPNHQEEDFEETDLPQSAMKEVKSSKKNNISKQTQKRTGSEEVGK